jgi:uncharacterized membrane protein
MAGQYGLFPFGFFLSSAFSGDHWWTNEHAFDVELLLKKRAASGEIDEEEYKRLKELVKD